MGDIVQVTGVGTGGWKIAQNAGQAIVTKNIPQTLTPLPTANLGNWNAALTSPAIASSADGTKLVVMSVLGTFTSADSGATWTQKTAPSLNWASVASSSDCTKLVAVASSGQIYTSSDSGTTWTPRATSQSWSSVASSSDGTKLVAVVSGGQIYTSTDSGVTWSPRSSTQSWQSVASSSDGTKLVAAVYTGQLYTSTNSGITWIPRATSGNWSHVASSTDGGKLVAVTDTAGPIYTSTDSGVTWTPRAANQGAWQNVVSSADGNYIVATSSATFIPGLYLSINGGNTWTLISSAVAGGSAVISSNTNRLVAVDTNNQLEAMTINQTTLGVGGSLAGSLYDAIELQYIGNNLFDILSNEGSPVVQ